MFFLLPLIPIVSAITTGEVIGIGLTAIGIGAGIKGSIDFHQAQSLVDDARSEYNYMAERIRLKAQTIQNRLIDFSKLKLQTYTGIIHEAVTVLSRFKTINLSSFKDIQVDTVRFLKTELETLETSCVKASDVLSSLSAGINAAVYDKYNYKDTPPLIETMGGFGIKGLPQIELPNIPYSAITMAGLSWGINGNVALTRSEASAADISAATERLKPALAGFKVIAKRISEAETLIASLSEKLAVAIEELSKTDGEHITAIDAMGIETTISLTKALKQIIEVDIVSGNSLCNSESGILFKRIWKEYGNDV
ncbi:hypothetical protein [Treponema primitia]|uniref:hypothetical protein n=1 Tax=Treponema primitia TaxID=88058 RepID=UPI00025553B7|nr:hypothetical protein [Treponema primitia]